MFNVFVLHRRFEREMYYEKITLNNSNNNYGGYKKHFVNIYLNSLDQSSFLPSQNLHILNNLSSHSISPEP